jgi:hypothetical protein
VDRAASVGSWAVGSATCSGGSSARRDVEVEVSFTEKRRPTPTDRRKTRQRTVRLRVVGVRHPDSGEVYLYITNVPPEALRADEVQACYSARWFGELLFREQRSGCQMRELPTRRPDVVRALVLCAAIRLMTSRAVLEVIRSRHVAEARRRYGTVFLEFYEQRAARRMGAERFQAAWRDLSVFILPQVLRVAGIPWRNGWIEELLEVALYAPNLARRSLWWRLVNA